MINLIWLSQYGSHFQICIPPFLYKKTFMFRHKHENFKLASMYYSVFNKNSVNFHSLSVQYQERSFINGFAFNNNMLLALGSICTCLNKTESISFLIIMYVITQSENRRAIYKRTGNHCRLSVLQDEQENITRLRPFLLTTLS